MKKNEIKSMYKHLIEEAVFQSYNNLDRVGVAQIILIYPNGVVLTSSFNTAPNGGMSLKPSKLLLTSIVITNKSVRFNDMVKYILKAIETEVNRKNTIDPVALLMQFYQPLLKALQMVDVYKLSAEYYLPDNSEFILELTEGWGWSFNLHFELPVNEEDLLTVSMTMEDQFRATAMKTLGVVEQCFHLLGLTADIFYFDNNDMENPVVFNSTEPIFLN